MPKIRIEGLDKLQKALKENVKLDQVKDKVKYHGAQLETKMKRNADFRGHYERGEWKNPSGTTKRSIGLEITNGGFTAEVEPGTEYSPYLEYGTRFMDAQPFVGPAYNEQSEKFKRDMKKLVR